MEKRIEAMRQRMVEAGYEPWEADEAAQEALRQADEKIMLLDQKIENAKSQMILTMNEKASLAARQQRYETMMEQVQLRHSEVAQKLLKYTFLYHFVFPFLFIYYHINLTIF